MSIGAVPSSLSSRTVVPPVVTTSAEPAVLLNAIEKAVADFWTVRLNVPGTALAVAVAWTWVELLVAVVGDQAAALARSWALVVSAANFALRAWRVLTVDFSVVSLDFSRV